MFPFTGAGHGKRGNSQERWPPGGLSLVWNSARVRVSSSQGQASAAVRAIPSTGPPLCDTSRSVSVRALLVTPFARDASPLVSRSDSQRWPPGGLSLVDRGFTGFPELPPNPERLIDLLELVALFRRPKRSLRDCGHRSPGSETGAQFLSSFGGHGWPRRFPRLRSFPRLCRGELPRHVQCLVDDGKHRGLERLGILPLLPLQKSEPNQVLDFRLVQRDLYVLHSLPTALAVEPHAFGCGRGGAGWRLPKAETLIA